MGFIHASEYLEAGDVVIVTSSHQCNVCVMDDMNFANYRAGSSFKYYGGHYTHFPARIGVPSSGHWHVTLDLGGGAANIRYNIQYLKRAA